MYARVAIDTGWTWEYIGQCLTLPRLYAMLDYWKQFPPLREAVAAFVGVPQSRSPVKPLDNAALTRDMHADPRTLNWVTKAANG